MKRGGPSGPRQRKGILAVSMPCYERAAMNAPARAAGAGNPRRPTQARVRRALGHPKGSSAHRTRRHAADQVSTRATGLASLVSIATCGEAGNCSTFARWPSHKRVSSTISPLGNPSASRRPFRLSFFTLRNRARRFSDVHGRKDAKRRDRSRVREAGRRRAPFRSRGPHSNAKDLRGATPVRRGVHRVGRS